MSSDEDFSLVTELLSEDTLEGVTALINSYKKQLSDLQEEHKELQICRDECQDLTKEFRLRCEKLNQNLKEDECTYRDQMAGETVKLDQLKQDENDLRDKIQKIQDTIKEQEAQNIHLKEQTDVFSEMPERSFVFKGSTAEEWEMFEMTPNIIYPMEGGTALITFEEEEVAERVLDMKKHKVDLGGECSINLEARPVHLLLPSLVEIDSEVCNRRILISDLPKMDTDTMMNELEIHFSKTKNGGGEVDKCEFLPDSRTVVITFMEKIARGLSERQYHNIKMKKGKHTVRVTPFLNGTISNLKTRTTACLRTVLLTGIPDVMEQETLQDLLEIHFQKNGNGGGEIEAFLYNPAGRQTSAVFGGNSGSRGD